ncbi:hypothetical protein WMY93_011515 [Mugilogobius chulae]|uniref:Retinoblastoma-like protein 1 n=1 Tax=Mugilogobius chulae TaxID=88201 RepID=A0AAW0P6Q2_9GOBI
MRGEESSDSESGGRMEESSARRSLEALCQELNLDEQTATEAMENFTSICNTYTLEGEVVHWLACALYAACRKGSVPTWAKAAACHISDVFKFCWTLFVYTKGNFSMIGDDLVNSYHLLLCCLDLVFGNALLCSNRKDLINPTFKDSKGNEDYLTEMLDPHNFIDNNKAINREYEEYVLTVGDFDERVFLGADADEEIGTPRKAVHEPVHTAVHQLQQQSRSRLQSMVARLRTAPSDNLLQIFKSCSRDPTDSILSRVKSLGQTFKEHYTNDSEDSPGSHIGDRGVYPVRGGSVPGHGEALKLHREQVLESRAWKSDSALWTALQVAGNKVPTVEEVYHLASVRLRDLCMKLDVSSELRGKVWTCFEHALVHCTELMKDRHLDQLLLCSIYIISKVTKEANTFQDIMKCYRSQPQANSHVYRSVLIRRTSREQVADENMEVDPASGGESAEKSSQGSATDQSGEEERGDLIQFYNSVFVLKMKSFALKYATSDNRSDAPPQSPFPSVRAQPLSPRRISQRHSLYVSPHKNTPSCLSPNSYTYRINSSPSKELSDINRMLRQGCVSRKRAFNIDGDVTMSSSSDSPSKRACPENGSSPDVLLKRLQDVVSERQSH